MMHVPSKLVTLLTTEFILRLYDHFQWWNGSDTFVTVTAFVFITP